MKVLNIIGKRPTGGIGAFTYNYQSHFDNKELEVDYLLFDDEEDGAFDKKVRDLGSKVYVLPALKNRRFITLCLLIDKFMKDEGYKYDIIHLHSVNIAFICFPSAKKYGVKHLIAHSHATVYSDKPINAIRNKILCRNLMKHANVYMACSIAAGEFLYGKQNMKNVMVLNNAIECNKFRFSELVRNEYKNMFELQGKYVIGNVGRICEQKNQMFLIDIFAECVKINPEIVLILVGDGPLRREVEDKVAKLGLTDKVWFLGARTDVEKLLQMFDVFVLPSMFEGLPVIGIEAQASGLPLVVSDEVTRELNLVDVSFMPLSASPVAWANKILSIVPNSSREDAFDIVSSCGYDINVEAKKLQDYYLSLVSN